VPPVARDGKAGQEDTLGSNDRFNPVGCFPADFPLYVTPDLYQVAGCLRSQDTSPCHSG
jgi:hypothetical protein